MQTSEHHSALKFITCGSVDDGKSTLIGRLLFDTKSILADTLTQMDRTSKKRGLEVVDLSLLTDGLQAEREQGIPIVNEYATPSVASGNAVVVIAGGSGGGGGSNVVPVPPSAAAASACPRDQRRPPNSSLIATQVPIHRQ